MVIFYLCSFSWKPNANKFGTDSITVGGTSGGDPPVLHGRVQPTVTIGGHVNVLHDYKNTLPSTFLKVFTSRCHHPTDMLVEFCQNYTFLTLVICLYVRYPAMSVTMFINIGTNYGAHVSSGQKITNILPPIKIR